jgi:catechol 2,3-dioxygenase-like lactoylglutathione lyase family enzyme
MAATRAFYEDVLGLPLVASLIGSSERGAGGTAPFLHCFFELGDGSSLAFFEFHPEVFGPADKLPRNGVDHHIAMAVPDIADVARVKAKLEALGYETCGADHGFCYSLYVRDPNGMLVELVADAANELELGEAATEQAHATLERWIAGNRETTSLMPPPGSFPLPSTPHDALLRVIYGEA